MKIQCSCDNRVCGKRIELDQIKGSPKYVRVLALDANGQYQEEQFACWLDRESAAQMWPALKQFAETGEWVEAETK